LLLLLSLLLLLLKGYGNTEGAYIATQGESGSSVIVR